MGVTRGIRRKRTLAATGVVLVATAGTGLFLAPEAHASTTAQSNQTVTILPSAQLTITANPIGSTGGLSGIGLGPVVVDDTMADSTDWSATVAASNCAPVSLPAGVSATSATIPASNLLFSPTTTQGQTSVSPTLALDTTATPASAVLGTAGNFANPASGQQFGAAQTLAQTHAYPAAGTDAYNNDGTYTFSPSLSVNTAGVPTLGTTYTCTLQYSVTG